MLRKGEEKANDDSLSIREIKGKMEPKPPKN
jgi:hypothetical protein